MDKRPELSATAAAPAVAADEAPRIYAGPGGDYSVLLGFGAGIVEHRVAASGDSERVESRPAMSTRGYELAELEPEARQEVLRLVEQYRAAKAIGELEL